MDFVSFLKWRCEIASGVACLNAVCSVMFLELFHLMVMDDDKIVMLLLSIMLFLHGLVLICKKNPWYFNVSVLF